MSIQETGQEAKFQKIGLSPLKESPIDRIADRVAGIISPKPRETKAQQDRAYTVLNFFKTLEDLTPSKKAALVGSTMLPIALAAACQAEVRPATPTPSFPEITPTPVEPTRIPTIQPTERPTFTPVPATKTPEPTPTSIFESQLSGKEKFMVALGGGAIGGGEELTPETVRTANQVKIIELATRLNKAVVDGQLPKTTKAENIIFTFGGIKNTGGATTVGAIVVDQDRLWRADSSGVKVWVENGASLYRNCSVMIEENKRFIVQEGKKLFRITETDATGFVNKMVEVDAAGNPVTGGKEKTSLLINALPDAQTGSNILEIPAKFLPIPEGQQLADAVSGFFNPVDGTVEFKDASGQMVASWDPVQGKFIEGSASEIFEKIPTPEPIPTVEQINVESRFYQPEFAKSFETVVDGINMNITIGLMDSLVHRALEPISSFEVARPDALEKMGKFYLQMCWQNYIKNNSGNESMTFEQYENLVKQGGGEITIAGVDESKSPDKKSREILKISPRKLTFIFNEGNLPVGLAGPQQVYIGKSKERLVLVFNNLKATEFAGITKANSTSENKKLSKGAMFSLRLAEGLSVIFVGNNDLLLRGYYVGSGIQYDLLPSRPYRNQLIDDISQTMTPFFWITQ